MPHRILVVDLETRQLASDLDPVNNERGWALLRQGKGGISALVVYDSSEDWTYCYDDNDIDDIAAHLELGDVIVGFNSDGFDLPVIEGILGRKLVLREHVDLFLKVKQGLSVLGHHLWRRGQYNLNSICERTLGRTKNDKGDLAPALAREGKWGRLFRYCANDVRLTRDLFEHIRREGGIISVDGTFLPVELPAYLRPGDPE